MERTVYLEYDGDEYQVGEVDDLLSMLGDEPKAGAFQDAVIALASIVDAVLHNADEAESGTLRIVIR